MILAPVDTVVVGANHDRLLGKGRVTSFLEASNVAVLLEKTVHEALPERGSDVGKHVVELVLLGLEASLHAGMHDVLHGLLVAWMANVPGVICGLVQVPQRLLKLGTSEAPALDALGSVLHCGLDSLS